MPDLDEADLDYLKRLGSVPKGIDLEGPRLLEELELGLTEVNDSGLYHIRGLTSPRRLYLGDTTIGDDGLAHLAGMSSLQKLFLDGTAITDVGLGHLANLQGLEWLHLSRATLSDSGLSHLKSLVDLEELGLGQTGPPDQCPPRPSGRGDPGPRSIMSQPENQVSVSARHRGLSRGNVAFPKFLSGTLRIGIWLSEENLESGPSRRQARRVAVEETSAA